MKWIEDRLNEQAERHRREKMVRDGIDSIWESLQAELSRCAAAYVNRPMGEKAKCSIATSDLTEIVVLSFDHVTMRDERVRSAKVSLERANAVIRARYVKGPGEAVLRIGLNATEQVCLLDETGKELSIQEAARFFLERLFFPDV